jgi:hypothetical protein
MDKLLKLKLEVVYRGLTIEQARVEYDKIIENKPTLKKTRKLKGK